MTAQPPRHLYTADDLLAGFNPWDEMGFAPTRDFSVYRQFVTDGGPLPRTVAIRIAQAKHDAGMHFVCFSPPYNGPWWACWVVMWLASHAIWRAVAFLLVTGGGPGVMEAAHLGVAFSRSPDRDLDDALAVSAAADSDAYAASLITSVDRTCESLAHSS